MSGQRTESAGLDVRYFEGGTETIKCEASDGMPARSPHFIIARVDHIAQIADLVKAARAVIDYEWRDRPVPFTQVEWCDLLRCVLAAEAPLSSSGEKP